MPKKGKTRNKSRNKMDKSHVLPEDQTPQTEAPPEQKQLLEPKETQETQSETPQLAADSESEVTLEQSQPTMDERTPKSLTDEQPVLANTGGPSVEPATAPVHDKQPIVEEVQGEEFLPPQTSGDASKLAVSHTDADESDNMDPSNNDTHGVVDEVNDDILTGISENIVNRKPETHDNIVNSVNGESLNDMAGDTTNGAEEDTQDDKQKGTTSDTPLAALDEVPNTTSETSGNVANGTLDARANEQRDYAAQHPEVAEPTVPISQTAEPVDLPDEPANIAAKTELTETVNLQTESTDIGGPSTLAGPVPTGPVEPVELTAPADSAEPPELPEPADDAEPIDLADHAVPTESVGSAEVTVLEYAPQDSIEPIVPIAQAPPPEPTEHVEAKYIGPAGPAAEVDSTDATDRTEPRVEKLAATTQDGLSMPAPDSTSLQLPSVAESHVMTRPQSSNDLPNFEFFASPMSYGSSETQTAATVAQPALSEPKLDTPRAASPAQKTDSFMSAINPFAVPSEPVQQPTSFVTQPAESAPNTASPIRTSSFEPTQVAPPVAQPVPIQPNAALHRIASQDHPPVSPLKPVRAPSHVLQATSPNQKTVSSFPQSAWSISPVSKAVPLVQKEASYVQQNGTSVYTSDTSARPISPIPRLASPLHSVVPKPASPAPGIYSPTAKFHSPLTRPYFSPMMSPRHAVQQPTQQAPVVYPGSYQSHPSGVASAFQSPVVNGGFLPPYTHSPYYASPPLQQQQQQQYGSNPQYNGYIDSRYPRRDSMFTGLGIDSKGFDTKEPSSPQDIDGQQIMLLQRIQDVIPDMGRLLHSYKSAKNKLLARETEIKQIQAQHEQSLMRKDFYIEALQTQMRKTTSESAEENFKLKNTVSELRAELSNLEEKNTALGDDLIKAQKVNQQLLQSNTELESEVSKLNDDAKTSQKAHDQGLQKLKHEHEEALASQQQEMVQSFEETRAGDACTHEEALEAQEKRLLEQQKAQQSDHESHKQQMQDAYDALQADVDSKVAELKSTQTDLSNARDHFDIKCRELDEARDAHLNEIDIISNDLNHQKRQWDEHRTDLEAQIAQREEELAGFEQVKGRLQGECKHKEEQLQRAMDEMHTTLENMDKDCDRLKEALGSLGEANSKGDELFLDSFEQLSHGIANLSKEHFAYLPSDPPKGVLATIPPELPSFLDNTPASYELRSAYVQHIVSSTLNTRVFQPFLFTLGHRHAKKKADPIFQTLSTDIRRKSTRREAFWRQQTLKTAYTTADAKHNINAAAALIVEEILDNIKWFADPKQLDALHLDVRRVVKLAAETWRHARVERELICASLPTVGADGAAISSMEWEEFGTADGKSIRSGQDPNSRVLLGIFPRIVREAGHGDFPGDECRRESCVYSVGRVLYSDSPVVVGRWAELAAV